MFIQDPGSDFIPYRILDRESEFFPSRIPDPAFALKNLSILTQNMVSKLKERWSGLFIPDPDPWSGSWLFTYPGSRITDPGVKRHQIPDPDPQHWQRFIFLYHNILLHVISKLANAPPPTPPKKKLGKNSIRTVIIAKAPHVHIRSQKGIKKS